MAGGERPPNVACRSEFPNVLGRCLWSAAAQEGVGHLSGEEGDGIGSWVGCVLSSSSPELEDGVPWNLLMASGLPFESPFSLRRRQGRRLRRPGMATGAGGTWRRLCTKPMKRCRRNSTRVTSLWSLSWAQARRCVWHRRVRRAENRVFSRGGRRGPRRAGGARALETVRALWGRPAVTLGWEGAPGCRQEVTK